MRDQILRIFHHDVSGRRVNSSAALRLQFVDEGVIQSASKRTMATLLLAARRVQCDQQYGRLR